MRWILITFWDSFCFLEDFCWQVHFCTFRWIWIRGMASKSLITFVKDIHCSPFIAIPGIQVKLSSACSIQNIFNTVLAAWINQLPMVDYFQILQQAVYVLHGCTVNHHWWKFSPGLIPVIKIHGKYIEGESTVYKNSRNMLSLHNMINRIPILSLHHMINRIPIFSLHNMIKEIPILNHHNMINGTPIWGKPGDQLFIYLFIYLFVF